jgi:putative hemolysin
MSPIIAEVLIIFVLLVINGIFAMSELAVVAARKVRLEHRAEEGDAGALVALELAAHPNNFLSTVQVGITLVGVLAGAFGGASIAEQLAERLEKVPWIAEHAEAAGLAIVVAAITYFSLILGELVPKRIALSNPERVASLVARPMRLVARLGRPLVWLLTTSSNVVFGLFGIRPSSDPGVTELDIRALVEQGAESGVVQHEEHAIVENAFRLGDRQVGSLMTPRPDVRWIDLMATPAELREHVAEHREARLLVCEGDLENVLGVVQAEDLLAQCLAGQPLALARHVSPPVFVPESMPALRLLEEFKRTRRQVAVVLDEFGGVQGIVTVDDLIAAVLGDLPERDGEPAESSLARQPDGSWLVEGGAALEDLEHALDLDPLRAEERRQFRTVGGLVMARLGRVARVGDRFAFAGLQWEVTEMDGRRIDTVRVRPAAPAEH